MPFDPNTATPIAAPVASQPAPFVPVSGPINAMMPQSTVAAAQPKVIATAPPRQSTAPTWSDPTPEQLAADPNLSQISSRGEKKYKTATQDAAPLNPNGRAMSIDHYLATGELPNMGMGGASTKTDIINGAGDKLAAMGLTGTDLVGKTAEFKADSAALTDTVKRRAQVAGYESTVEDSIGLAQNYANKALANTGFTTANKMENWWSGETGDAQYKGLQDAVQTVTNEYAKVISNATNGGVTSDQARQHAEAMLSASDSPQAFKEAVSVLKQEMQFRINGMDRQVSGLSLKLHSALGSPNEDGSGDYAAFSKAYQAKNNTNYGANAAWLKYKQTTPNTPWRGAMPNLKPAQAASAQGLPDPLGLR